MIFPDALAKQLRKYAGQKYRPSNATEGSIFINEWCANCAKDKEMSEGKPFEECEPHELCPLIGATHLYDVDDPKYPPEWIYGGDGQPKCTAFIPNGEELTPVRCEKTIDMFMEAS